jgi:hypothetical protein
MRALASLVVLAAACDRPEVLVICHNANCVEPADPALDDTLESLRQSLQLSINGRPVIDGIELDLFWRGSDGQCLLAHDLEGARTEPATVAAQMVADHLASTADLTYNGGPFQVFLEVKNHVGAETDRHTPEQRRLHAACLWDVFNTINTAAVANGRDIDVFFASFGPELLREVYAQTPAGLAEQPRYEGFYGIPKPLDSQTTPLDVYAGIPITLVEFHVQWIHDAQYEGVISMPGVDIGFFMFSATVETFAAIEQYEPYVVNTSEARLLRRWLEN